MIERFKQALLSNEGVKEFDSEMLYICPKPANYSKITDKTALDKEYLWYLSNHAEDIEWNIFISKYIIMSLYKHIQEAKTTMLTGDKLIKVLTYVQTGFFRNAIAELTDDDNVEKWLIDILSKADDTIKTEG